MIAFHKDLYWNVRQDPEDKYFVYIWRYTPTDKCTERVTEEGITVYEKHLRVQVVKLMDIEFGVLAHWFAFRGAYPVDNEHIKIGTALDVVAEKHNFEPERVQKGRAVYWTAIRRYDECQGFYVTITHYQTKYLTRGDVDAFNKEQKRVTKEEWLQLYQQVQEAFNPQPQPSSTN